MLQVTPHFSRATTVSNQAGEGLLSKCAHLPSTLRSFYSSIPKQGIIRSHNVFVSSSSVFLLSFALRSDVYTRTSLDLYNLGFDTTCSIFPRIEEVLDPRTSNWFVGCGGDGMRHETRRRGRGKRLKSDFDPGLCGFVLIFKV